MFGCCSQIQFSILKSKNLWAPHLIFCLVCVFFFLVFLNSNPFFRTPFWCFQMVYYLLIITVHTKNNKKILNLSLISLVLSLYRSTLPYYLLIITVHTKNNIKIKKFLICLSFLQSFLSIDLLCPPLPFLSREVIGPLGGATNQSQELFSLLLSAELPPFLRHHLGLTPTRQRATTKGVAVKIFLLSLFFLIFFNCTVVGIFFNHMQLLKLVCCDWWVVGIVVGCCVGLPRFAVRFWGEFAMVFYGFPWGGFVQGLLWVNLHGGGWFGRVDVMGFWVVFVCE